MGRSRYSQKPMLTGQQLAAQGYMDLQDRGGQIASKCSYCGSGASFTNPLAAEPTMADPAGRLRGHLVRVICQRCTKQRAKLRVQKGQR